MADSDSDDSVRSNASSYTSVDITTQRDGTVSVTQSNAAVPEWAPPLPSSARNGTYDVESQQFRAVLPGSRGSRMIQAGWNAAQNAWEWTKHHRSPLSKAIIDFVPTGLQTVADSMSPGRGQTGVTIAATAFSTGLGIRDLYQEGNNFRQNDPDNPASLTRTVAGALRLAGAGMNLRNAIEDPSEAITRASGYVSGAATMLEATSEITSNPVPPQTPAQRLYPGQGHNVELGQYPGQYPTGNNVSDLNTNSSGTGSFAMGGLQRALPLNAYPQQQSPYQSQDSTSQVAYSQRGSVAYSTTSSVSNAPQGGYGGTYTAHYGGAESSAMGAAAGYPPNPSSSAAMNYTPQQQGTWETAPRETQPRERRHGSDHSSRHHHSSGKKRK